MVDIGESDRVPPLFYFEESVEEPQPDVSDGKLIYAGHFAESIPTQVTEFAGRVTTVDLSYNMLRQLDELNGFGRCLKELILDNNKIDERVIFPKLLHLSLLSLCNNKVTDYCEFLDMLSIRTPKLEFLSLLANPSCPTTKANAENDEEATISKYKYIGYVCYRLPRIRFLDSKVVSTEERDQAKALRRKISSWQGNHSSGATKAIATLT